MDNYNQTDVLVPDYQNQTGLPFGKCFSNAIPKGIIYQGVHFFNRKYILPVELFLGVAGNLIIFATFLHSRNFKIRSSKLNLTAMALADVLFLLFHFPQLLVVHDFARTSYQFMYAFVITYPFQLMLINTSYTASVW